jgi:hypothetical protein
MSGARMACSARQPGRRSAGRVAAVLRVASVRLRAATLNSGA